LKLSVLKTGLPNIVGKTFTKARKIVSKDLGLIFSPAVRVK